MTIKMTENPMANLPLSSIDCIARYEEFSKFYELAMKYGFLGLKKQIIPCSVVGNTRDFESLISSSSLDGVI